ncbi:MAG: hypothetical protein ACWGPN_09760, partial [Gammaproteobacteria bacterium]
MDAAIVEEARRRRAIGAHDAANGRNGNLAYERVIGHRPALEGLVDALQGRILVDATARVDFRDPRPPEAPSAGRIAQQI